MKLKDMNKAQIGRVIMASYKHKIRITGILFEAKLSRENRGVLEAEYRLHHAIVKAACEIYQQK